MSQIKEYNANFLKSILSTGTHGSRTDLKTCRDVTRKTFGCTVVFGEKVSFHIFSIIKLISGSHADDLIPSTQYHSVLLPEIVNPRRSKVHLLIQSSMTPTRTRVLIGIIYCAVFTISNEDRINSILLFILLLISQLSVFARLFLVLPFARCPLIESPTSSNDTASEAYQPQAPNTDFHF